MKTKARRVTRIEPGQVLVLEVERDMPYEQLRRMADSFRSRGIEVVVLGPGISVAGVCNVRPWKKAK